MNFQTNDGMTIFKGLQTIGLMNRWVDTSMNKEFGAHEGQRPGMRYDKMETNDE